MSGLSLKKVPIKNTTRIPWHKFADISPNAVQMDFLIP
jgi:hypothetical protein